MPITAIGATVLHALWAPPTKNDRVAMARLRLALRKAFPDLADQMEATIKDDASSLYRKHKIDIFKTGVRQLLRNNFSDQADQTEAADGGGDNGLLGTVKVVIHRGQLTHLTVYTTDKIARQLLNIIGQDNIQDLDIALEGRYPSNSRLNSGLEAIRKDIYSDEAVAT